MSTGKTHYQVLQVDPSADEDEIKKAYKRLARIYHPDLNPKRPAPRKTGSNNCKRLTMFCLIQRRVRNTTDR